MLVDSVPRFAYALRQGSCSKKGMAPPKMWLSVSDDDIDGTRLSISGIHPSKIAALIVAYMRIIGLAPSTTLDVWSRLKVMSGHCCLSSCLRDIPVTRRFLASIIK